MNKTFGAEVQRVIQETNHVLISHGVPKLQDNDDFAEGECPNEDYVEYVAKKSGTAGLRLTFSKTGVEIGISDFYEFYDFSCQDILANSKPYEECLSYLLFNAIVIKRCLFGFNYIYIKKSDGELFLIRKVYEGCAALLLLPLSIAPLGCKYVEYRPMYDVSKNAEA